MDRTAQIFGSGGSITSFALEQGLNMFQSEIIELKDLVTLIIEQELEKAKKQGAQEQIEKIGAEVKKDITIYVKQVTDIVDYVNHEIPKKFPEKDLKITESRARFDFVYKEIKILFLIETDLEIEFEFSKFLSDLTTELVQVENVFAELFYINVKDKKLDTISINQDYPSKRLYSKKKS